MTKCDRLAAAHAVHARRSAERLEDLTFMAETGESFVGAAARLGVDANTLERWLERRKLSDLANRLHSRDPLEVTLRAS